MVIFKYDEEHEACEIKIKRPNTRAVALTAPNSPNAGESLVIYNRNHMPNEFEFGAGAGSGTSRYTENSVVFETEKDVRDDTGTAGTNTNTNKNNHPSSIMRRSTASTATSTTATSATGTGVSTASPIPTPKKTRHHRKISFLDEIEFDHNHLIDNEPFGLNDETEEEEEEEKEEEEGGFNNNSIDGSSNNSNNVQTVAPILASLGDLTNCRRLTLVRAGASHQRGTPTNSTSVLGGDRASTHSYNSSINIDASSQLQLQQKPRPYHHQWAVVQNPFPVAALTAIVNAAKRLVCLEVCRIRLDGTPAEFLELARAIDDPLNCTYLRAFSLEQCRLNRRECREARQSALEPVIRALVCNPIMGDITLIADKIRGLGSWSTETVEFLGRSPSLLVLRLGKLGLGDEHIAALAHAVKRNEVLRTLKLSCYGVGYLGARAIVKMLERNSGSLEKFYLFVENVLDEEATIQIAHAMQSSSSLKQYELGFGNKQMLSSRLQKVHAEVMETRDLAKELEFTPTNVSNCPFIRVIQYVIDAPCIHLGGGAGGIGGTGRAVCNARNKHGSNGDDTDEEIKAHVDSQLPMHGTKNAYAHQ